VLVAGSYIFKADNPTQTIADLKIDNDIKQKKPALTYLQGGYFISAPLISERFVCHSLSLMLR
jgi:hypothetical protein